MTPIQHCIGNPGPGHDLKKKKKKKEGWKKRERIGIRIRIEEISMSLFADDMIKYMENAK